VLVIILIACNIFESHDTYIVYIFSSIVTFSVIRQYTNAKALRICWLVFSFFNFFQYIDYFFYQPIRVVFCFYCRIHDCIREFRQKLLLIFIIFVLIKIRAEDREDRQKMIDEIVNITQAHLIQVIGNVMVIYRAFDKEQFFLIVG
jgi:hypothetical protein